MLVLLAQPQTELEEQARWLGTLDSFLSERGRYAAIDFSRHDMWIKPDRVYLAPAAQHVELAKILSLDFIPLPELSDRSMGSLSGRPYRETMAEFPRRNWLVWQRSYWTAPPEGESLFDISDRVLRAFTTKILPITAGETVLIICSANIIRLIIGYLRHLEEDEIPKIAVEGLVPYVINSALGCTE